MCIRDRFVIDSSVGRHERLKQAGVIQAQLDNQELQAQVGRSAALVREATERQRNEIKEFVSRTSQQTGFILSEKQAALKELEQMQADKARVEAEVAKACEEKAVVEQQMRAAEASMRAAAEELDAARGKVHQLHEKGAEQQQELQATMALKEQVKDQIEELMSPVHAAPPAQLMSPGIQAECEAALWQQMEARLGAEAMAWRTRAEATEAELRKQVQQSTEGAAELHSLKMRSAAAQEEAAQAVQHRKQAEQEAAQAVQEAAQAVQHRQQLEQSVSALTAQLHDLQASAQQAQADLVESNARASTAEQQLAAARAQQAVALESRLLGSEQTLELLESQRAELERCREQHSASAEQMRAELMEARAERAEAESRAAKAAADMAKLLSVADAAQHAAQDMEQAHQEGAEQLQQDKDSLGAQLRELQQETHTLRTEKTALAAQLELCKAQLGARGEAPSSRGATPRSVGCTPRTAERLVKVESMMARLSEAAAAAQHEVGVHAAQAEADSTTDRLNRVETTIQRLAGLGLVDVASSQPPSCAAQLKEYQVLLAELQSVRLTMAQRSAMMGEHSPKAAEVLSGAASTDQQLRELQARLAQGPGAPAQQLKQLYDQAQRLRLVLESDIRALSKP
eukprot:TRINITY_DN33198_c0_g1_i1.p1 TRINITY_DN33198_c0_g1~~TRINITY_DN33198_c0_g1_i1.p1  ORF type:complete len:630 (+),score=285.55 TRINITY_DN33198_c0_g1_i1:69-1958(+)